MAELHNKFTNLKIDISQEQALGFLKGLNRVHTPTFFKCGIIDAGIGFYQLAELPSGERILLFAINLEDLQLKDWPGLGRLYATPEKLYGVDVYDATATGNDIDCDLRKHQTALMKVIREDYLLVRTGPNIFQSRAVTYVLSGEPDLYGKPRKPTGNPDEKVHIHAFHDALHTEEYARAHTSEDALNYDRLRYSHVHLTPDGSVKASDAMYKILAHHGEKMRAMARGGDGIQAEDKLLHPMQRLGLRLNIASALVGDAVASKMKEVDWSDWKVWLDLASRAFAVEKMPAMALEAAEHAGAGIELGFSIFDVFHSEKKGLKQIIPEKLLPYVEPVLLRTRLNAHLYQLSAAPHHRKKDPTENYIHQPERNPYVGSGIEMMTPINATDAGICPTQRDIMDTDPFEKEAYDEPSLNSIRAMLGTMVHLYPRTDPRTALLLQPNGLWIAYDKAHDKIYVGYNDKMDTACKPYPPPLIAACLGNDKVICFDMSQHQYLRQIISIDEARSALPEIVAGGGGAYLVACEPKHVHQPHVLISPVKPTTFCDMQAVQHRNENLGAKSKPVHACGPSI